MLSIDQKMKLYALLDRDLFPLLSGAGDTDQMMAAVDAITPAVDTWQNANGFTTNDVWGAVEEYISPWYDFLEGATTTRPGPQAPGVSAPGGNLTVLGMPVFSLGGVAVITAGLGLGYWLYNRYVSPSSMGCPIGW